MLIVGFIITNQVKHKMIFKQFFHPVITYKYEAKVTSVINH